MMNRRDVLNVGVSAAATAMLTASAAASGDQPSGFRIVDTNIDLFHWPFRRLPFDDPTSIVGKLRSLGIDKAWAGSFEGLLHRDISGVNRRLTEACREYDELIPIGSINPTLPGWESDLHRCCKDDRMPGIRLHPNYHGYTLDDPRFNQLMKHATTAGRFVQIAAAMEDPRTQHEKLQVADVDLSPLADVLPDIAGVRVQILNHRLRGTLLAKLADTAGVFFDTARVESTDGVPVLVKSVPPGRVLFGSHAPFLIAEAALIRVHESGILDEHGLHAVLASNAAQFGGRHAV